MPKERVHIPIRTRRRVLIEAGFQCSIPKCTENRPLEFHHIDGNPKNNQHDNLLVLCKNHHGRVTSGEIDKQSCILIKSRIEAQNARTTDTAFLRSLYESIADVLLDDAHADKLVFPEKPNPISAPEILAIRNRLSISQEVLAYLLNVSLRAVRSWESSTAKPTGAALRLLDMANESPQILLYRNHKVK
jgi:DNA-binding transcriptional regulator YiaG